MLDKALNFLGVSREQASAAAIAGTIGVSTGVLIPYLIKGPYPGATRFQDNPVPTSVTSQSVTYSFQSDGDDMLKITYEANDFSDGKFVGEEERRTISVNDSGAYGPSFDYDLEQNNHHLFSGSDRLTVQQSTPNSPMEVIRVDGETKEVFVIGTLDQEKIRTDLAAAASAYLNTGERY